jgi:hypothetical protein
MNEYIITCDEETASWIGNDVDSMRPIVRCRDCRYISSEKYYFRYCYRMGECKEFPVELDGFCAWGERKEVAA